MNLDQLKEHDISLVVTDLDGTLLKPGAVVGLRTKEAVKRFLDAGNHMIIATGRPTPFAEEIRRELDPRLDLLTFNGAALSLTGEPHQNHPFPQGQIQAMAPFLEDFPGEFFLKTARRIYALREKTGIFTYPEKVMPKVEAMSLAELPDLGEDPILKVLCFSEDPLAVEILKSQLRTLGTFTWTEYQNKGFELVRGDRNKGVALKEALDRLGIPREKTLAVGDGENDLDLFRAVGLGIAMGNAVDALKAVAGGITASNEEEGVAHLLEHLLTLNSRKER